MIFISNTQSKYSLRIFNYIIKLIIIGYPHLSSKHACGNHFFLFHAGYDFYDPLKVTKNDAQFTSIYSPNQEVLEYPQKHALILHVQRLYWVRPANNTGHDYLVLVQFDLVDTYFYSK